MISTCLDLALLCHPVLALLSIQRPKMHTQESKWQYFLFSFVCILGIRYASTNYSTLSPELMLDVCQTVDQPNPIASLYPMNATGTLNGTVAVIPISLKLARKLIPSQYGILEHAYRDLLPDFPEGMYPAIFQALHDHEVQAFGYQIPDFTRTGIEFPFVDLLGDNSTSFKWAPSLLMTADHEIALKGALDYGTNVYPSTFSPACDAYSPVPDAKVPGTTIFSAESTASGSSSAAAITSLFAPTLESAFPLSFYVNFTNQPTFADGKTCDNMIRLFNTSVTVAPNRIESVVGTVRARIFPFGAQQQEWRGVHGLRMDTAFIENNYLPCESFRGYGA